MSFDTNLAGMGTFFWKYLNNRAALPAAPIHLSPNLRVQWALLVRAREDYDPKYYSIQSNKYPMPLGGDFKAGDWVNLQNEPGVRVLGGRSKVLNKALYALLVHYPDLWSEMVVKTILLKPKTPGRDDLFGNLPSINASQETWLHLYLSPVAERPVGPWVQGRKIGDNDAQMFRVVELVGPKVVGEHVEIVKHERHAEFVQWVRDHRAKKAD